MESSLPLLKGVLYRRGWVAVVTLASAIAGAIFYLRHTPSSYQVSAQLILNDRAVGVSELGRNLSEVANSRLGESSPLATQSELLKSQKVLKRALNTVSPEDREGLEEEPTIENIRDALSVKIVPATTILEVSYQSKSPYFAVGMLNSILEAMVQENAEEIRMDAKSVREFLEQEVPRQQRQTEETEEAERQYRQEMGLVNIDQQAAQLVDNLAQLEIEESRLLADYQEKGAQVRQLQQLTGIRDIQSAYKGGRLAGDREIEELQAQLARIEAELAVARSQFTDREPEVVRLLKERESIRELYESKVASIVGDNQNISRQNLAADELSQDLIAEIIVAESQRSSLNDRLQVLRQEKRKLQQRLEELPQQQQMLSTLVRQREEAEATLNILKAKLEEARLAEAQLLGNIRIIELAELEAVGEEPNSTLILALAFVFGTVFSICLMILLELLDNQLHQEIELEGQPQLPLLGVLPKLSKKTWLLREPDNFLNDERLVEPYRLLLNTLEFRDSEKLGLFVVSSAVPKEGKSTVVAHLAAVSALLSRRTLIIDADLRSPQQHFVWGVPSEVGLTEVLDKKISLKEAIKPILSLDNLSLLTCGQVAKYPSQLIESVAMRNLLQEATANYDWVIVDTPCISEFGDAYSLSRSTNNLLLVTRPNVTPKDVLAKVISNLTSNGAVLAGVIFNHGSRQIVRSYPKSQLHSASTYIRPSEVAPSPERDRSFNQSKQSIGVKESDYEQ